MLALTFNKQYNELQLERIWFEYDLFATRISGDKISYNLFGDLPDDKKAAMWEDIITKCVPYVPDHFESMTIRGYEQTVNGSVKSLRQTISSSDLSYSNIYLNLSGNVSLDMNEPDRVIDRQIRKLVIVLPEIYPDYVKHIFAALFKIKAKCINFDCKDIDYPCFVIPNSGRPIYVYIQTKATFIEPRHNLRPVIPSDLEYMGFPTATQILK